MMWNEDTHTLKRVSDMTWCKWHSLKINIIIMKMRNGLTYLKPYWSNQLNPPWVESNILPEVWLSWLSILRILLLWILENDHHDHWDPWVLMMRVFLMMRILLLSLTSLILPCVVDSCSLEVMTIDPMVTLNGQMMLFIRSGWQNTWEYVLIRVWCDAVWW